MKRFVGMFFFMTLLFAIMLYILGIRGFLPNTTAWRYLIFSMNYTAREMTIFTIPNIPHIPELINVGGFLVFVKAFITFANGLINLLNVVVLLANFFIDILIFVVNLISTFLNFPWVSFGATA